MHPQISYITGFYFNQTGKLTLHMYQHMWSMDNTTSKIRAIFNISCNHISPPHRKHIFHVTSTVIPVKFAIYDFFSPEETQVGVLGMTHSFVVYVPSQSASFIASQLCYASQPISYFPHSIFCSPTLSEYILYTVKSQHVWVSVSYFS